MNKILIGVVIAGILFSQNYYGSTTAPVTMAGGIIKAKNILNIEKKYKRKDCPVCKGKGWYLSGDSIKKVECGYCEPDDGTMPKFLKPELECDGDSCKTKVIRK